MSKVEKERLYNLLPSVYRIRDMEQGEPLRALLAVIEGELERVEEDIDSLYENWFIETCDEWVVPYIGDILGVHGIHSAGSASFSLRPYVANTMAYRRRKGTITVLEQLARDVTGWHARAVEFFQLLSVTSHVNHISLSRGRTLDLRDSNNLELSGTPFELSAHTCEMRSISRNCGKYNIPNLGIFLWRLQSYKVTRSTARPVSEPADGRYTFNPLGFDAPLFNRPQTETRITQLAGEVNVPGVLRRRPLYDELEARRRALAEKKKPDSSYFGEQPVFEIYIDGQRDPVTPEEILICDLSDLQSPGTGWRRPPEGRVAVDPELGRMALPAGPVPDKVEVSYAYGFSNDTGGGPYNRQNSVEKWYSPPDNWQVTWQMGVTKNSETLSETPEELEQTLKAAIMAWNAHAAVTPGAFGIISIMDSSTYDEAVDIDIPPGSRLAVVAADWPMADITGSSGQKQRLKGQIVPDNLRPHLKGNVSAKSSSSFASGELILDGLLIEGKLAVLPGNLGSLHIAHCTLVPRNGGMVVEISDTADQQNAELGISIDHSICGAIALPDTVPELYIANSIIDNVTGEAISAPGASVSIQTSTIFGSSTVNSLEANNSIFTGTVSVERRQEGCVRFTYVPEGSQTPRRYHCQPDLAIQKRLDSVMENVGLVHESQKTIKEEIKKDITVRLKPAFTSLQYGKPGYAQLHSRCPVEIWQGAEDEAEMGAFHDLYQPQRETNLRLSLNEYMRFGLKAGIFYVS